MQGYQLVDLIRIEDEYTVVLLNYPSYDPCSMLLRFAQWS
jgi:hypothetical protein